MEALGTLLPRSPTRPTSDRRSTAHRPARPDAQVLAESMAPEPWLVPVRTLAVGFASARHRLISTLCVAPCEGSCSILQNRPEGKCGQADSLGSARALACLALQPARDDIKLGTAHELLIPGGRCLGEGEGAVETPMLSAEPKPPAIRWPMPGSSTISCTDSPSESSPLSTSSGCSSPASSVAASTLRLAGAEASKESRDGARDCC